MEPGERLADVHLWLRYAREDLTAAEMLADHSLIPARHICWLAQQAAEKALKAALIFAEVDFPRRHDLDGLRNLLPVSWTVKQEHPDLAILSEWAVEARYPGEWPEPVEEDARMAVKQARSVYQSVCRDLLNHGFPLQDVTYS
jgi:HEPN domain-containing protein